MLVLTLPILHAGMLRKREAASLTQGGPASPSGCRDSRLGRDILERDLSAASPCQWLVPSHTCLPSWRCMENATKKYTKITCSCQLQLRVLREDKGDGKQRF